MKKHSLYIEGLKSDIIKEEILTAEIFDFYKKLFEYQEKFADLYAPAGAVPYLKAGQLPAFDPEKIIFSSGEAALLSEGLDELTGLLKQFHGEMNFDSVSKYFASTDAGIKNLFTQLLQGDVAGLEGVSGILKIGVDELIFILVNWLKPFFVKVREDHFNGTDTSEWYENRCPFCGYYPDMSTIVEKKDSVRMLHCGFCENEWKFKRIGCAVCGNENTEKLGYYEFETKNHYRFDYCDQCKGYIKTIRIAKMFDEDRYDLTVENIITNFLDSSALSMGFNRP